MVKNRVTILVNTIDIYVDVLEVYFRCMQKNWGGATIKR